ncbi:hypothetical protein GGI07_004143 [Coemansia sp. Benny D115]|nr:hypothetical protein GGI07_004143 [Coemansia sp. Benny D115]
MMLDFISAVYHGFPWAHLTEWPPLDNDNGNGNATHYGTATDESTAVSHQVFWGSVVLAWALTIPAHGQPTAHRNYSIIDRIWPLYPAAYTVYWTWNAAEQPGPKALVAVWLVCVWALRLLYNSVRRGDYRWGAEDYRWAFVRAWFDDTFSSGIVRAVVWEVFNFGFIAAFQLGLLYLLVAPVREMLVAGASVSSQWMVGEVALVLAMAALLAIEAVADEQQYRFQCRKRSVGDVRKTGAFVTTGLWQYSRHPNVLCEQAFWLALGVYCAWVCRVDLGDAGNVWWMSGSLLLVALMWGSVRLTEDISRRRYPLYRAYQLKTSRLLLWPPKSNAQVIATAAA